MPPATERTARVELLNGGTLGCDGPVVAFSDGSLALTGIANGTGSVGMTGPATITLTAAANARECVIRFGPDLGTEWVETIEAPQIAAAPDGGVLLSSMYPPGLVLETPSRTATTESFFQGPSSFLARYDAAGALLWVKQVVGATIFSVTVAADDSVYAAVSFGGDTIGFGPGEARATSVQAVTIYGEALLARFDADGSFASFCMASGPGSEGFAVAAWADGSLGFSGSAFGSLTLGLDPAGAPARLSFPSLDPTERGFFVSRLTLPR